jgi:hypothetical protein
MAQPAHGVVEPGGGGTVRMRPLAGAAEPGDRSWRSGRAGVGKLRSRARWNRAAGRWRRDVEEAGGGCGGVGRQSWRSGRAGARKL